MVDLPMTLVRYRGKVRRSLFFRLPYMPEKISEVPTLTGRSLTAKRNQLAHGWRGLDAPLP
jgi:hypothetical protein